MADPHGALDILLIPLAGGGRDTIPLTLLLGVVLALLVGATKRRSNETASHGLHRAYFVLSCLAVALSCVAHAEVATIGLVALMCLLAEHAARAKRLRALLACLVLLPLILVSLVTVLGFADLPLARAAVVRRLSVEAITTGKLLYVDEWGFIDRTHVHRGQYKQAMEALAALHGRPGRVRVYVEIVDAADDIYVVERHYAVPANAPDDAWAFACAMALDVAEQAERVQSHATLRSGFRISAYQSPDLLSNLFGCLRASGRLTPRAVATNIGATLRWFRSDQRRLSEARVTRYALPRGASATERDAFVTIQRARSRLRPGPLRVYLHPISR